jgi:hypothetical protein
MAETLGSLIDKLTIKSIREFYIKAQASSKGSVQGRLLEQKLEILQGQKTDLLHEIESFISHALKGDMVLRDDKLKLYNSPEMLNRIGKISTLSSAIDKLSKKNLQLWQLEDMARDKKSSLSRIGIVKRKIDAANQQRNDLIDKIDELLEKKIKKKKKSSTPL